MHSVPCCGHSGASPAISGIGWRYAAIRLKASTRRQQSRRKNGGFALSPIRTVFLDNRWDVEPAVNDAVRGCFTFVPTPIHCGGDASPSNAELSARPTARLRKRRPRRHDVEASVVRLSRLTIRGQSAVVSDARYQTNIRRGENGIPHQIARKFRVLRVFHNVSMFGRRHQTNPRRRNCPKQRPRLSAGAKLVFQNSRK